MRFKYEFDIEETNEEVCTRCPMRSGHGEDDCVLQRNDAGHVSNFGSFREQYRQCPLTRIE